MILADTSVWADHIRYDDADLSAALLANEILIHPFVLGEIAIGSPKNRKRWLEHMQLLPASHVAEDEEVLELIEGRRLHGVGIGYVDAHLAAATLLTPGARLWTRDKKLAAVAATLGIAMTPPN